MHTLYDVLAGANETETRAIQCAYNVQNFPYQYCQNADEEFADKMVQELNYARDILTDPGKRAEYDAQLELGTAKDYAECEVFKQEYYNAESTLR